LTCLKSQIIVWAKVAYSAITVATTLTNETVAVTIAKPRYHEMMANLVAETLKVAVHEGVDLTGTAFDKFDPELVYPRESRERGKMLEMMVDHASIMRGTTKVHSGTWRDIVVRKKRTESHDHFRPIFELANKACIQMPMCHILIDMLGEIEDGKRYFSDDNLEELLQKDLEIYPR
jgi:2-dehydropantoate 2-reductase